MRTDDSAERSVNGFVVEPEELLKRVALLSMTAATVISLLV